MKSTVKALKSKYAFFIISIIGITAAQVMLQYWFDHETIFSLILSAAAVLIIILEFVYIFLPALQRLSATNRKLVRLRKNLEERERQYRELVEGATDIIYELNSNGEFSFVNELMLHMSGYTLEEVIGRPYLELIHPDDRAYAAKFYREKLKAGLENSYLEFRMFGKHGQTSWIGQNVRYFYEGTWVTKVRVVARDITEGRQAQLALQKLKEEAERTTIAKSQFLSMMSHEIRTPMNAIIGLTNILADSKLTKAQRGHVELLKFSGENLLAIINDILDLSKIEAQKIVLEAIDFDLRKVIGQTLQIHMPKVYEKNVALTYSIDESIPQRVTGDPVRFIQVVNNLISNAVKFTPTGSIRLVLKPLGKNDSTITLQLSVSDTGIAPDKHSTIFESFAQAEAGTARQYGGTGLGLTITKKLVELMGGTIIMQSIPGAGTTFTATLVMGIAQTPGTHPSVKPETEEAVSTEKAPEALTHIRVLLAEDNVMNQVVAMNFLKKWNVRTTLAVNGQEALDKILHEPFDLVLMDLQMPLLSGYEVAALVRAREEAYYRSLPIIALTASAMVEVKNEVLSAGMNDFLSKPFQPDELRQVLEKYGKPME